MIKALKASSLLADLAATQALLDSKEKSSDPIGWFQLSKRRDQLSHLVEQLKNQHDTHASVALFFGGSPVIGSKGIQATFAGKALEIYQDMLAKRVARLGRGEDLPDRGRVPGRANASLMVTEIARGSFGFVLEEPKSNADLIDSALKKAIEEVSNLLHSISVKDLDDMEDEAEILDQRLLLSVRDFFRLLDDSGATIRIMADHRHINLTRDQVVAGRSRIDSLKWSEQVKTLKGKLFIIPDSQRFDLEPLDGGETIRGKVNTKCIKSLRENNDSLLHDVLGKLVTVKLIEKEVRSGLYDKKTSFTLDSVQSAEHEP